MAISNSLASLCRNTIRKWHHHSQDKAPNETQAALNNNVQMFSCPFSARTFEPSPWPKTCTQDAALTSAYNEPSGASEMLAVHKALQN